MRKRRKLINTISSPILTDTEVKNMDIHIIIFYFQLKYRALSILSNAFSIWRPSWDRVFPVRFLQLRKVQSNLF